MAATTTRTCPKCGGSLIPSPADSTRRTCAGCGARFSVPTKPAPQAASVRAGAPAAANAFADLAAPATAAPRHSSAPAAKPRTSSGIDPRLGLGLLIGGLAVLLLGLTTVILLAVIFWPRPAPQPTVVVVAPVETPAVQPASVTEPPPATTKPPVADDPKPTPPTSKPAPPKDDPPPIHDAPPPLQPTPPDLKPEPPPQPAPDVKPAADPINTAIDKAVVYLKKEALNAPAVRGPAMGFVSRQTGEMGLIGLALLESGVPADDPAVAACVNFVRTSEPTCDNTYEMAICLWFLDRLGDPKDEDLIHDLGTRLIAGQLENGKWTYQCPTGDGAAPKGAFPPARLGLLTNDLTQDQLKELMETLDKYDPSQEIPAKRRLAPVCHYVRGKKIEKTAARPGVLEPGAMMFNAGDLSLTQFAVLGLWVARKHHLPVDRSLLLSEAHVRSCQAADGGWAYNSVGGLGMGTTDSMTCSGLMELAVGRAVGQPQGGKTERADPQFEKGIEYLAELFDRGVTPPKPGDAVQAQNLQQANVRLQPLARPLITPIFPGQKQNWTKDLKDFETELEKSLALDLAPDALKDLKEIDDTVKKIRAGGAATQKEKLTLKELLLKSSIFQAGGAGPNPFGLGGVGRRFLKPGKSNRNNLDDIYCLWSLERLCMVCDLKTVAGRDWYAWGAALLVAYQNDDGSWADSGICGQRVDTCLAVLFLKRVNVAKDLTAQLKLIAPIKDLSPDKLKYVSPGDTPSPGLTPPSPVETPKETPKP